MNFIFILKTLSDLQFSLTKVRIFCNKYMISHFLLSLLITDTIKI